jgi:pheromone shutdown protein TraB
VTPGADFRAARRAAERVGATLVLGDRPIEIILERAASLAQGLVSQLDASQKSSSVMAFC